MNFPLHREDAEDFTGNIHVEAHNEMVQQFGQEKLDSQWILTDYDVWAKNPYYVGPDQPHPELDHPEPVMTKNVLHFGKARGLSSEEAAKLGLDKDSGNGYYSYSHYILPFSGVIDAAANNRISNILFKRHYRAPFVSLLGWKKYSENELIVSVTYHHGD